MILMRYKSFFRYSLFTLSFFALVACTESFEDRCRREAREFTEKQCPRAVDKFILLDSMTFTEDPVGFAYHYRVSGELDNPDLLTDAQMEQFRQQLLKNVRTDISLKQYKEKGFTFGYYYTSASTGKPFTQAVFGPEDY